MNMTKYKIQTVLAAGLFLLAGCADEYQSDYQTDQPADVALANYVGSFDVLKAYAGSMHIGAEVPMSTLGSHNTAYSQLLTNFSDVQPTDAFTHAATVSDMGKVDSTRAVDALAEASNAQLTVMGGALSSPLSTQTSYMSSVTADTYVPGTTKVGDFKMVDFNDMALGTKINGSGGTPAEVVQDPNGEKGHVLHYTAAFNHCFVNVKLPEGMTLGDITEGYCDYMLLSTGWVPASVVKVVVDGTTIEGSATNAVGQGIEKGKWGIYHFSLEGIQDKLSAEQKAAKSFQLGIGDVCSNPNYYIGAITLTGSYSTVGHYEPRPLAEKQADARKALNTYMKTVVGGYGDKVKTWILAADYLAGQGHQGRLLTSKDDDTHYYINEYLGDDFVVDLAKMAKSYQNDAVLFYSDNDLDRDATKLANLETMIKEWNDKGAGLAGVNAEVHLRYNAGQLSAYKKGIDNMLKALVATGLKVRLSGLDMEAVDDNGNVIPVKKLSESDIKAMADYYDYVVKQYISVVPEAQRYGLSFSDYTSDGNHVGLWSGSYNRQSTYAGVASGLQGTTAQWPTE